MDYASHRGETATNEKDSFLSEASFREEGLLVGSNPTSCTIVERLAF
jgi:hypothetical protein